MYYGAPARNAATIESNFSGGDVSWEIESENPEGRCPGVERLQWGDSGRSVERSEQPERRRRTRRGPSADLAVNPIADFHDEYSRAHCGHAHTPLGKRDIELSMFSREQVGFTREIFARYLTFPLAPQAIVK